VFHPKQIESADVDEKLLGEITSYEILTEELKKSFLMLLMLDAKRLADACISNTNIHDKASASLIKIENLIDSLNRHEIEDINKSKALQELTIKAKTKLNEIREHMEAKVKGAKVQEHEYKEAQKLHRSIK